MDEDPGRESRKSAPRRPSTGDTVKRARDGGSAPSLRPVRGLNDAAPGSGRSIAGKLAEVSVTENRKLAREKQEVALRSRQNNNNQIQS